MFIENYVGGGCSSWFGSCQVFHSFWPISAFTNALHPTQLLALQIPWPPTLWGGGTLPSFFTTGNSGLDPALFVQGQYSRERQTYHSNKSQFEQYELIVAAFRTLCHAICHATILGFCGGIYVFSPFPFQSTIAWPASMGALIPFSAGPHPPFPHQEVGVASHHKPYLKSEGMILREPPKAPWSSQALTQNSEHCSTDDPSLRVSLGLAESARAGKAMLAVWPKAGRLYQMVPLSVPPYPPREATELGPDNENQTQLMAKIQKW